MPPGNKGPYPEQLSESEKRHFSKYGKLPRGGLLGKRAQERTYFDSGDFALSAADHETDTGAIKTGREHPQRESISQPYAPIPATCNADKKANDDLNRRSASPTMSPLHQRTNSRDEKTGGDGEDKPL
ncbi:hypothetical protein BJX99DRAFT_228314 [Aspergillus californicus]